jgi:hypothetical protein
MVRVGKLQDLQARSAGYERVGGFSFWALPLMRPWELTHPPATLPPALNCMVWAPRPSPGAAWQLMAMTPTLCTPP